MSTPQTPALVEPNSLSETLLEIAAKHGNAASVDIVASYAALLSDSGRDALMHAISECYPSNRPAPFGVWQPIETAPRDGTRILCYCDYSNQSEVLECHHGLWLRHVDDGNWGRGPTHWMPLPTPPQV